jgi:RNA polymerase sigma-70 factor (ECF subfamily)
MDRHGAGLYRFVFRHISNEADAVELTQETFVRAHFNIWKYRPTAKFVTWLYRIALNLCRDHARSRASHKSAQTVSTDAEANRGDAKSHLLTTRRTPDTEAYAREIIRALETAIAELPLDLKSALILTALEGHSHVKAGELLGITGKAVETKVYRARKILFQKMRNLGF